MDGPLVDGVVDRQTEVDQQQGRQNEVERRVEARVIAEVLLSGHGRNDTGQLRSR